MWKLAPLKLTAFKTVKIHFQSLLEKELEFYKLKAQKNQLYNKLNKARSKNLSVFVLKCQIIKLRYIVLRKARIRKVLKRLAKVKNSML